MTAYRVITYISSPDFSSHTSHVRDFDTFASARTCYDLQTCSARVMAHALIKMPGERLERKGWAWADPKFRG